MDMNNLLGMEKELEIKSLREEIKTLKNEMTKMKILMKEADIEVDVSKISDEESICVTQMKRLRDLSENNQLTKDEVQILDILHKNLKLARGEDVRVKSKGKVGKMSSEELTNIIKG